MESSTRLAQVSGFSLHAGVLAEAGEREKLDRLCRYIARPAAATQQRFWLTPAGQVRYQLKTPYRDGTTHVLFEPVDFIARLAALVPKPRVNLTRYHRAPNSHAREQVTPARRGKRALPPPEKSRCERRPRPGCGGGKTSGRPAGGCGPLATVARQDGKGEVPCGPAGLCYLYA